MSTSADTRVEASNVASVSPVAVAHEQDTMVPRGAIAFFVAMLVAFAVIWLGMYEILVVRQSGL